MKLNTHLRYEGWSFYKTVSDDVHLAGPLPTDRQSPLEMMRREGLVVLVSSAFQTARRSRLFKNEAVARPPA
jgi:hypothetical protein